MKDDWSITTGDGGVALYLPSDFGAELDAHTGDGSIRNDLDKQARRRVATGERSAPRLGAGGKTLRSAPATARSAQDQV